MTRDTIGKYTRLLLDKYNQDAKSLVTCTQEFGKSLLSGLGGEGWTAGELAGAILEQNGCYVHFSYDPKIKAYQIDWAVLPNGEVIRNDEKGGIQFRVNGGLTFIIVNGKVLWLNAFNVVPSEHDLVSWRYDPITKDMPDISSDVLGKDKSEKSGGGCMGGEEETGIDGRTRIFGLYRGEDGTVISLPPMDKDGTSILGGSEFLLTQYFQRPLTSVEPRGFDSQAGFVPGAALVQDFVSSSKLREWMKMPTLKVGCEGDLDVILYYNGIGTRGMEWNPARVEAPVLPHAERREFVAASGNEQMPVQECRVDAAPAAQQAPMQFAYDDFEPAPARFRKEKRAREKPIETKNVAGAESKLERKEKNLVGGEKAGHKPSAKRAADETPFWRIDSQGRMKPFHAPRGMCEGAPASMPKLKVGVPKLMGKFVFGQEETSPAKLSVVEKAKDPMPLREKKKKRRRKPAEMRAAEKPAEKPKRPAAKVRFGDAVPLSSGIQRKKVRREMPVVELRLEKRAKRRAEKRKEIALGQDAAISTKRKARRKEKAVMLDEEARRKNRGAERKKAGRKRMDAMEYMVMGKKKRGKRKYWAPLSLR
jgi:hypothetical protein